MDTGQQPDEPGVTPHMVGFMPLEPGLTPSPLEPGLTPSPDESPATFRGVPAGAVGFVHAVAKARIAAASVKRTSMYTSEALCS
jgi:hypothetical protein